MNCSFVIGSSHYLAHCRFSFCDQLRAMDGQSGGLSLSNESFPNGGARGAFAKPSRSLRGYG